jgi:bacillithiol synthase
MQMAENRTMDSDCIPSSSIPHTSRLFDDFLHHFEKVRGFYARPPLERNWWRDEIERIDYPSDRRHAVAAILERQNREFGAGEKALGNIAKLREGAPVVVTGQQVGLMGGPLYCLLKAVSVAGLAESAGAVPVFWLASEDHDFEEINFVNLPASDRVQKFSVNVPHPEDVPVGTIVFGDEITAAIQQVEALFGKSEVSELLAACYRKGENFAGAFARFYAKVLGDLGVVFLNPLDPELHRVAQPVYTAALEKSAEINHALLERARELENAGYHAQVKVTPSHTLCFYLENGIRTPVRQETDDGFIVGERKISRNDLLAEAERCPENFSANVLLRPIVEDHLLPTLCYVGGPSEIAYFAQVETVYRRLASRVTPVLPRIFATLVEPRQAKLLDRYGLKLPDLFLGPERLMETIGEKVLPKQLMRSFDTATHHLDEDLQAIREELENLDRTLLDAAENAASKMRHQLNSLREKAARAETRKSGELQHHAAELATLLFPNKELQEREIGAAYFLLRHGLGLVESLKQNLKPGCADHQVVFL